MLYRIVFWYFRLIEACPDVEPGKNKKKLPRRDVLQRLGSVVSHGLETFFYKYGISRVENLTCENNF